MTLWTLAARGVHNEIALGMKRSTLMDQYGEPDDTSVDGSILTFNEIEFHFADERLWLVHCEFGSPPLPNSVASERLRLEPEFLVWPVAIADASESIQDAGIEVVAGERYGMTELRFGMARLLVGVEDELAAFSVSN